MSLRFFRGPLVLMVATLSVPLLAAAFDSPFEAPVRHDGLTSTPQLLSHSHVLATPAVIPSDGAQAPEHPTSDRSGTSITQEEQEQVRFDGAQRGLRQDSGQAIQEALIHSSQGRLAIEARDRAQAQRELDASIDLLSRIPETASTDGRRLKLIEEIAALKAALSAASPEGENHQPGKEEEGAETEETPDLVSPEEEPSLTPPAIAPDSVPELDLSKFDVPIVMNEKVKAYIEFFQTRKRDLISLSFQRAGRYLPMMREIFRELGLPLDLINLAHIESAFNYRAFSRAKASGIWQFIKATGHRYGMRKTTYWEDERRDPEKATRGAATYLKDLYEMFDSWPHAIAAYNAGEQRVERAILRQGTKDFWSLKLPRETQLFVPAFMAITVISKDPEQYGFARPVEQPWEAERAVVPGAIELRAIARAIDADPQVIRDLNPTLLRGVTPVGASKHEIRLPPGTRALLLANVHQLPRYRWNPSTARQYRVRRGDTLGEIASRHRTTVALLAELNGLKASDFLRVGMRLTLPQGKRSTRAVVASPSTVKTAAPRSSAAKPVLSREGGARASSPSPVHIVRRGDTIWGIAKAYAVTPEDLRRWNDLGNKTKIQPGQPLRIGVHPATKSRQAGSGPAPQVTRARYKVKRGDTLWDIAAAHGVTVEELREWNDLRHQAKLLPGQVLRIGPSGS